MSNRDKKTPSGQHHTDPHINSGQHDKCDITGSIHVAGEIETKLPPDLEKKRSAAEEKKEARDKKRFVVEWVTLVFVIVYAGITGWIAYINHSQWKDLRHNFAAQERAWIEIKEVDPPPKIDEDTVFNAWGVKITNPGKSIALEVHIYGHMEIVDKEMSPSFSFPENHFFQIDGAAFFPGSEGTFPIGFDQFPNPRALTKDEIQTLLRGDAYLAAYVEVLYRDQFGWHWTRYCGWRGFAYRITYFQSRSCVVWNTVGDGKPSDESQKK